MLPMLLESFVGTGVRLYNLSDYLPITHAPSEDMRRNQHLITNDVVKYMAEYEVGVFVVRYYARARSRYDRALIIPALAW
jgi:hypothetical protein